MNKEVPICFGLWSEKGVACSTCWLSCRGVQGEHPLDTGPALYDRLYASTMSEGECPMGETRDQTKAEKFITEISHLAARAMNPERSPNERLTALLDLQELGKRGLLDFLRESDPDPAIRILVTPSQDEEGHVFRLYPPEQVPHNCLKSLSDEVVLYCVSQEKFERDLQGNLEFVVDRLIGDDFQGQINFVSPEGPLAWTWLRRGR